MLQLRSFRPSWAASMRCVLLPGGVFWGTAIRDFEAESVSDVNLSTDKWGDMLCLSGVVSGNFASAEIGSFSFGRNRQN